ncbi:MAG: extracellular solute-binding protein [Methylophilaceae bacterium]|nr:extracellular solute-binding protein [Methylophilaceae bacterium]
MKTTTKFTSASVSRRRFLTGIALGAAVMARPGWALTSRQTVTVLTNHNDDTFSLLEEAFEKAQPHYRIKLMWMMPPDALKFLHRSDSASLDVWWQAAPHNHIADLAKEGLLQPLPPLDDGLPPTLGTLPLVAMDNSYHATQLTAFSFLVNSQAIAAQQLPWPSDWTVLAQPEYAGKVALSDPVKVRFNNMVLDVVLQTFGWEQGWALLSAISGNAVILSKGLTDEVSSGKYPVALHIDIVPNAEQRMRQPLECVYPAHGGIINAGYIGILKQSPNTEGARAFVNFVLSASGQQLLPRTDLPRLPVRPVVYAALGKTQFNPFEAQKSGQLTYQARDGAGQAAVVSALFGALVKDHAQLSRLWARLHIAEKKAHPLYTAQVAKARSLLQQVPINEALAGSDEIKKAFRPPRVQQQTTTTPADLPVQNQLQVAAPVAENNNAQPSAAKDLVSSWEQAYSNNQAQAAKLLDEVGA